MPRMFPQRLKLTDSAGLMSELPSYLRARSSDPRAKKNLFPPRVKSGAYIGLDEVCLLIGARVWQDAARIWAKSTGASKGDLWPAFVELAVRRWGMGKGFVLSAEHALAMLRKRV